MTEFNDQAALGMLRDRVPQDKIKRRPGGGGVTYEYVDGSYVKRKLLDALGLNFSTEIMSQNVFPEKDNNMAVVTHVRISVHLPDGRVSSHDGIGTAIQNRGKTLCDVHKASATDALKRAATHFGIALDLYEDDDERTVQTYNQQQYQSRQQYQPPQQQYAQAPSPAPRPQYQQQPQPQYQPQVQQPQYQPQQYSMPNEIELRPQSAPPPQPQVQPTAPPPSEYMNPQVSLPSAPPPPPQQYQPQQQNYEPTIAPPGVPAPSAPVQPVQENVTFHQSDPGSPSTSIQHMALATQMKNKGVTSEQELIQLVMPGSPKTSFAQLTHGEALKAMSTLTNWADV